jgi:hypothetical protein
VSRPWSPLELDEEMQNAARALEDLAADARELGAAAGRAKWAYRRAQAKAIAAGVTNGIRNDKGRQAAIWDFLIEQPTAGNPLGVTVADVGERADVAAGEFEGHKQALYAVVEQGKIIQSLYVTAREAGKAAGA